MVGRDDGAALAGDLFKTINLHVHLNPFGRVLEDLDPGQLCDFVDNLLGPLVVDERIDDGL